MAIKTSWFHIKFFIAGKPQHRAVREKTQDYFQHAVTSVFYMLLKLGGGYSSHFVIIAWKVNAPHASYLKKTPLIYCTRSLRSAMWEADCQQMRCTERTAICRRNVSCWLGLYFLPDAYKRLCCTQAHFHHFSLLYLYFPPALWVTV